MGVLKFPGPPVLTNILFLFKKRIGLGSKLRERKTSGLAAAWQVAGDRTEAGAQCDAPLSLPPLPQARAHGALGHRVLN